MAIKISVSEKRARARLAKIRKALEPESVNTFNALTRIGNLISSRAKINITRQKLIDTGNLRARTDYRVSQNASKTSVDVGVFGVPYAGVHEYGFDGQVQIKTHIRVISQAFGRQISSRAVQVRAHQRQVHIPARPYLRPAVRQSRARIKKVLRDLVNGK